MKITIVTTSLKGGAGYAAQNLYKGLIKNGADAGMLTVDVLRNWRTDVYHRLKRWWLVRKFINSNYELVKDAPKYDYFTFPRTGYQEASIHPLVKEADVINLHWINNMVDYGTFFNHLDKPVIWTLHDTASFTGGCHYTFGCEGFLSNCQNCMQLSSWVNEFAAAQNLQLKIDSVKKLDPAKNIVVAPSLWLKSLSEKSKVFSGLRHFHIPYGMDTDVFKHKDKAASRQQFNIAPNKFVILFVSTQLDQTRKGFDLVLKLREQFKDNSNVLFIAVGGGEPPEGISSLGYINNPADIAAAYSAANVFLIPSRQDNLPNTMLEALCCGTPVIGHAVGGMPDAIEHQTNGFLVTAEDVDAMHRHIIEMINDPSLFNNKEIAAQACAKYALNVQANAYLSLIADIF